MYVKCILHVSWCQLVVEQPKLKDCCGIPQGFDVFCGDNGVRWPAQLCVFVCKPIQLSNTKDI